MQARHPWDVPQSYVQQPQPQPQLEPHNTFSGFNPELVFRPREDEHSGANLNVTSNDTEEEEEEEEEGEGEVNGNAIKENENPTESPEDQAA
jgi:hypothetical protein